MPHSWRIALVASCGDHLRSSMTLPTWAAAGALGPGAPEATTAEASAVTRGTEKETTTGPPWATTGAAMGVGVLGRAEPKDGAVAVVVEVVAARGVAGVAVAAARTPPTKEEEVVGEVPPPADGKRATADHVAEGGGGAGPLPVHTQPQWPGTEGAAERATEEATPPWPPAAGGLTLVATSPPLAPRPGKQKKYNEVT